MEGTIGEIRIFAGTFAPSSWMFCDGRQLSISQYTTLYSIIGTTYGGDGVQSFQIPNVQSRVVIGAGQGVGLPNYTLGQTLGEENHTLTQAEMPLHTHTPAVQYNSTPSNATFTLMGHDSGGTNTNPSGNFLAPDTNESTVYAPGASNPLSAMNAGSVQVNSLSAPFPTIAVGTFGQGGPHSNVQPVNAAHYIICVVGIYPSRD